MRFTYRVLIYVVIIGLIIGLFPGVIIGNSKEPLKIGVMMELSGPQDLNLTIGEEYRTITWYPEDNHPDSYEILLNGSVIEAGSWDGSLISFDVPTEIAGTFNYTLVVYDEIGNNASDSVLVRVFDDSPTTTTDTNTIDTTTDTLTTDTLTTDTGISPPDQFPFYWRIFFQRSVNPPCQSRKIRIERANDDARMMRLNSVKLDKVFAVDREQDTVF